MGGGDEEDVEVGRGEWWFRLTLNCALMMLYLPHVWRRHVS